jgi:hypothetical protein
MRTTTCVIALLALALMGSGGHGKRSLSARLSGFLETPASISSSGSGRFRIKVNGAQTAAEYELQYEDLEGSAVLFAHIHLGQPATGGGVMVFLCSNQGGPAGTPACPGPDGGSVEGTLSADDVIGPAGQGIAAGEFEEFLDALQARAAYVNVHTDLYPSGELRGNIR